MGKRKVGRPVADHTKMALRLRAEGLSLAAAAGEAGIDPTSLRRAIRRTRTKFTWDVTVASPGNQTRTLSVTASTAEGAIRAAQAQSPYPVVKVVRGFLVPKTRKSRAPTDTTPPSPSGP